VSDPEHTDPADWETAALDRQRSVVIVGVAVELPSLHPVLTLREVEHPWRELRIPVGMPEGAAIASALRAIASPRPLTHDLFAAALQRFDVRMDRVVVTEVVDATFHAEITLTRGEESASIACRPSDAVALSLRNGYPVPVFATERVLRAGGAAPDAGW
jgi:bifunctional DNase/RNase